MLQAAEDGESPLPQLHDAAGLAFGLLGLIVLLSLPATRAIRVTPRRTRSAPEEAPAAATTLGG